MLRNKRADSEELIELVRNIGAVNQQLGNVQSTIDKLDKKIDELAKQGEDILEVKLKQQQLEQAMVELKNKNIDIELRINSIENATGKHAKDVITKVMYIVLAAFVGAVLMNINSILSSLGG